VTEGRRREFKEFSAFSDPQARERIPDPQDSATFLRSRVDWSETARERHAAVLRLYRAMLALRRTEPLLHATGWEGFEAVALTEDTLLLCRRQNALPALLVIIQLRRNGSVSLQQLARPLPGESWHLLLSSEDPAFAPDPLPVRITLDAPACAFARPGAVILKRGRSSIPAASPPPFCARWPIRRSSGSSNGCASWR